MTAAGLKNALLIGLAAFAGGAAFSALNIPVGWLLGAMIASATAANFVGAPENAKSLRRAGQLLIGVGAVGTLTQELLLEVGGYLPLMLSVAIFANFAGILFARLFQSLARIDRKTAILSSLPAGMAEMSSLAVELGARVDIVVITHTIRVTLVLMVVPVLLDVSSGLAAAPSADSESPWGLLTCMLGGLVLALLADRLNMMNTFLIMPMLLGIALVSAGIPVAPLPPWLLIVAQILIGLSLGVRLLAPRFASLPRAAIAGVVCSAGLIAVMTLAAAPLVVRLGALDLISVTLGIAPGGLGEMIAAAKSSAASVAIVAGFQLMRSIVTNVLIPPLLARTLGKP